jgi:hypothetical protein
MENTAEPPPWGTGHVIRPAGTAQTQRAIVYQASEATSHHLHELATENGISDIEFVKLGLALAEILTKAKKEGNRLAIVDRDGAIVNELVGV